MNTKQTEALKLALEALEQIDDAMPFPVAKLAQKVIREALAEQPAQQQEPCGWRMRHNGVWAYSFTKDAWDFIYAVSPAARKAARDNAPASKPWVGLTDEERQACTQSPFTAENYLAIEAKLKEKNGF